jgi:hydrogenase expression/formation protein HypE
MRDLTRGGLTAVLCELCAGKEWGFLVDEDKVPVRDQVRGLCELLGYDPLGVANEGKLVAIVKGDEAPAALEVMRSHRYGRDGTVIGAITAQHPGKACLNTVVGGTRVLRPGLGEDLPRIC